MQDTTRFSKVEDVILITENFTPEYKEIQSVLKDYFSFKKISIERTFINTRELNCISFDDISRIDKDRLKNQICPVFRLQDSDRALVKVNRGNDNSHLIIKEVKENSFSFYSTSRVKHEYMIYEEEEPELCDIGEYNLKYSEYEIVYCIIKKLAKNRVFEDLEEFEKEYKFYKTLFADNEKDFLKCLLYPDKLNGYYSSPYDYTEIQHYSDLKTRLFEIKNGLVNTPAPPATAQMTNKKPIIEKPMISFKAMFKDPSEYDKVLGYISEYLTETKQWKESIIYLSAFYGVLRDRGYLNKIYNAPQINRTLKNEFGIDAKTTDKNFQDTPINRAVATFVEAFNMIPSLKSTK